MAAGLRQFGVLSHLDAFTKTTTEVGAWGKVARVRLDSAVMFEPDLWTTYVSGAHPTDRVVDAIKAAAGDPDVKAIVLEMNGPGGSVAGYDDIRNAIAQAKETKVVQTLVHDGAFSRPDTF